jgi:hypothetical protein
LVDMNYAYIYELQALPGHQSYVPSFGSEAPPRGRRGGGNAPPPGLDRAEYLRDLQNQIGKC